MITLVNRLHKERKARKITQDQAGDLIGVSGRKYRDFENGYSSLPVDQVFRLAAALGVRVFNADNLADEQGTANQ
jgi:transcriptional regulator with XRE-family HTH domain